MKTPTFRNKARGNQQLEFPKKHRTTGKRINEKRIGREGTVKQHVPRKTADGRDEHVLRKAADGRDEHALRKTADGRDEHEQGSVRATWCLELAAS